MNCKVCGQHQDIPVFEKCDRCEDVLALIHMKCKNQTVLGVDCKECITKYKKLLQPTRCIQAYDFSKCRVCFVEQTGLPLFAECESCSDKLQQAHLECNLSHMISWNNCKKCFKKVAEISLL